MLTLVNSGTATMLLNASSLNLILYKGLSISSCGIEASCKVRQIAISIAGTCKASAYRAGSEQDIDVNVTKGLPARSALCLSIVCALGLSVLSTSAWYPYRVKRWRLINTVCLTLAGHAKQMSLKYKA